jgi:hypothetical protein
MRRNRFLTDFFIFTVYLVNNLLIKNMARSLRYLLIFLFTIGTVNAFAQGNGSIEGNATDENGEPIIGAIIEVYSGGIKKGGAVTDIDGNYIVKPLAAGVYEVLGRYSSYKAVRITGISVGNDGTATANLSFNPNALEEVKIVYVKPLISNTGKVNTSFDAQDIKNAPTRDLTKLVATSAGMVNNGRSGTINAGGDRGSGTVTMLDGIMIRGGVPNLPQAVIGEIEVELGGMPAKRGDATGAVVSITTRGPSSVYTGAIQIEKSVEGFGHNLANITVSGPVLSKKLKGGEKKPVLGFLLNGEAIYDKNRQPSYNGNYVVKEDVLRQLEAKPLVLSPNNVGAPVYNYATEFVRKDQLKNVKVMPNADIFEGRAFGKLDYQLNDNMNLTAGANITYTKGSALANGSTGYYNFLMFAPEAIPVSTNFVGRGYLRFTQRFNNKTSNDAEGKQSRIQNAFYSLQGDYTKSYSRTEDRNHGRNIFDYAYLGKFYQNTESRYLYDVDTNTGTRLWQLVSYDAPTSYTFERSEKNAVLANYTSSFYDLGNLPPTISELRGQRGLANGDLPAGAYGLYTNVGTAITGYNYSNDDQISASANASFDLLLGNGKDRKRHAIEFGLYYQQSIDRGYSISANIGGSNSLWQVMRSSVNKHIVLDLNNPLYRIGGVTYTKDQVYRPNDPNSFGGVVAGIFDSLFYNRMYDSAAQTNFDKNLRAKLGLPVQGTDMIQLDNLDPSTFSLDMFSADELINSLSGSLVGYQGYDYLGRRLKGQVNFNDYFTEKDANGNFTRNIGAYRPSYIAGYIQDRFRFKDINFNIGLRVDRYDLNTKVLKDPYSLYETYKVGDRSNADFVAKGDIPGNMGDDYVVYVDNNQASTPRIIGFRNGDEWYNASGQVIQDPAALRAVSGRDPQPYLTKDGKVLITDPGYEPTRSFTDYKPQTSLSPRIAFQFPISDKSQFYAHYDILVQRPTAAIYATPYDYLYMTQIHDGADNPIANPNLKPTKTFDYEFGFSQALSTTSVISIAGTYKERKDQIQRRAYIAAWPQTYFSYDNRDFSTTKGFYLKYDLRRTKNLRLLLNYTLQFVEGTGSNENSAGGSGGMLATLIASQLPNLRTVMPLDFDSRHGISATIDYRFADGQGPVIGDKHFLQNAGINLLFTARSGEPYTRYAQPTRVARTIKGELNGSRLPWHSMLDLRIDKDFALTFKKAKKDAEPSTRQQRMLYLNVYCYINNVLNIRDVISVNGFTGRPDDDGYLVSPQGVLNQSTQTSPQSYNDLYTINQLNPYNINLPRRINFGLGLNF